MVADGDRIAVRHVEAVVGERGGLKAVREC
jgi:hypothetical protein